MRSLLHCSFAIAADFFAAAILPNSSLTLVSAAAVSFPVEMFPLRAAVSCCAAAITRNSGDIVGVVMYW